MSETLLRQWNLLQRIPAHPRKITTAQLKSVLNAEGIHVEMRSLQRDLNYLSQLFPLVQDDRSKPYGWCWAEFDSGKHIPGFSPCVAMTLLMAQKFLMATFPKEQLKIIENHFKQAEEVLNELHSDDLLDWRKKIHIHPRGFHLQPVEVDSDIANAVYDAVLCQTSLKVDYFSKSSDANKTMFIEPLGIVVRDAMTYVICQTDQYDDYIQLALHRFRSVETGEKFEYPVDFDLEDYINSGKLGFSLSDKSIDMTLRFSKSAGSHFVVVKFFWPHP